MKRMISPEELKDSLPTPPSPAETTFAPLLIGNKKGETKIKAGVLNNSQLRFSTQNPYAYNTRTIEIDTDLSRISFEGATTRGSARLNVTSPGNYDSILWLDGAENKTINVYLPFYNLENNSKIPAVVDPAEDGTYTLKLVKSGSSITYKWVKDM